MSGHMISLVEQIETYIKRLLQEANGQLRLQRNDLADVFNCVPSQINYVLKTRFTIERGYLVESQRGGGGFIEIRKLIFDHPEEEYVCTLVGSIGDVISQQTALNLIFNLEEKGILTKRESAIFQAIVNRSNLNIQLPYRDFVRAQLLKAALGALMKSGNQE